MTEGFQRRRRGGVVATLLNVLNPELRSFATDRGIRLLAKPFDLAAVSSTVDRVLGRT